MWTEENTERGGNATSDEVVRRMEAIPGTTDDIDDTYEGVKVMSGKVYNYLVKNCTDEAFGIVR